MKKDKAPGMEHDKKPDLTTLGARLRHIRKEAKLSPEGLAELCGWGAGSSKGRSRITNYENNSREPSIKDIEKMAKHLKHSASWITYGGPLPNILLFYSIPVLSPSGALNLRNCAELQNHQETISMDVEGFEKCYGMRVTNDLMKPDIGAGEVVVFDREKKPTNGCFVVAHQKGSQEAMVKKYLVDGTSRFLISNEKYIKEIKVDESVEILGIVVAIRPPTKFLA